MKNQYLLDKLYNMKKIIQWIIRNYHLTFNKDRIVTLNCGEGSIYNTFGFIIPNEYTGQEMKSLGGHYFLLKYKIEC